MIWVKILCILLLFAIVNKIDNLSERVERLEGTVHHDH